jgi:hypothetical protein
MRNAIKVTSLLTLGMLCFTARNASAADNFGSAGTFAIGGERLFGLVVSSLEQERGAITTTQHRTSFTLLNNGITGLATGYSSARIAFDYFPINGLSLGGSVGFFNLSASQEQENGGVSVDTDQGSQHGFIIAPRVGYAFMFSPKVGLWPRGGITYLTASTDRDNGNDLSTHALALTIEAPLVIAPVPHVAFLVGPTLDLGLSGSTDITAGSVTTSSDLKATDIGVQAGITVYF